MTYNVLLFSALTLISAADLQLRENASYRHNQQLSQLPQTSAHFSSQQVPPSLPPFREPKMQGCGLPATAHAGSAFQAPTMPSCQHPARVYTRALPTRSQVWPERQELHPQPPVVSYSTQKPFALLRADALGFCSKGPVQLCTLNDLQHINLCTYLNRKWYTGGDG